MAQALLLPVTALMLVALLITEQVITRLVLLRLLMGLHAHTNISEDNQFSQTNNTNFSQLSGSIQQRNGYWSGHASGVNGYGDSLYFYIQEFGDLA